MPALPEQRVEALERAERRRRVASASVRTGTSGAVRLQTLAQRFGRRASSGRTTNSPVRPEDDRQAEAEGDDRQRA